jgi:hypothetical protein
MGVRKVRWLLFIYVAFAVARPAIAQCDGEPKADSGPFAGRELVAADLNVNRTRSAELAKQSGMEAGRAPSGFNVARGVLAGLDDGMGGGRSPRIKVALQPLLACWPVEMNKNVVTQPCLYGTALNYRREKTTADYSALAGCFQPIVSMACAARFAIASGEAGADRDHITRSEVERTVKPVADQIRQPGHDARMVARRDDDTPDEPRQVPRACDPDA